MRGHGWDSGWGLAYSEEGGGHRARKSIAKMGVCKRLAVSVARRARGPGRASGRLREQGLGGARVAGS